MVFAWAIVAGGVIHYKAWLGHKLYTSKSRYVS